LGQTSPSRPLQGFRFRSGCSARTSPSCGRPSQGWHASRSTPSGIAATSVRRTLHVVFTTSRCSAVRPSVRSEDRPAAPAGFASLSGFGPERPLQSVSGPDRPSWGLTPLQRLQRRDSYDPGPPRTRHHPSSGFLTPSTVCSPFGLADTLGPLPLMGFALPGSFER